jgi:hypothetical protein
MEKLTELCASFNCAIDDNGIKNLKNITKLDASGNKKINNVGNTTKLINFNKETFCDWCIDYRDKF